MRRNVNVIFLVFLYFIYTSMAITVYVNNTPISGCYPDGSINYSNITDAINAVSDGDTIIVCKTSSTYVEDIIINKSINMFGNESYVSLNPLTTTGQAFTIKINANYVNISNFSIIGNGMDDYGGIDVNGFNNTKISNNYFSQLCEPAVLVSGSYNLLINNIANKTQCGNIASVCSSLTYYDGTYYTPVAFCFSPFGFNNSAINNTALEWPTGFIFYSNNSNPNTYYEVINNTAKNNGIGFLFNENNNVFLAKNLRAYNNTIGFVRQGSSVVYINDSESINNSKYDLIYGGGWNNLNLGDFIIDIEYSSNLGFKALKNLSTLPNDVTPIYLLNTTVLGFTQSGKFYFRINDSYIQTFNLSYDDLVLAYTNNTELLLYPAFAIYNDSLKTIGANINNLGNTTFAVIGPGSNATTIYVNNTVQTNNCPPDGAVNYAKIEDAILRLFPGRSLIICNGGSNYNISNSISIQKLAKVNIAGVDNNVTITNSSNTLFLNIFNSNLSNLTFIGNPYAFFIGAINSNISNIKSLNGNGIIGGRNVTLRNYYSFNNTWGLAILTGFFSPIQPPGY
ncbi:MAG: hypothetical protein QXI89_00835, partial [Candidatus Anstonellales archaeon]